MLADTAITRLVTQIHTAGRPLVMEFAGAGSVALMWLHSVGGSSRTILEATDRYSTASMTDLLGVLPVQAAGAEAAQAMANAAYLRACRLASDGAMPMGVACTAALASDRVKRGDHRAFVAVQDATQRLTCGIIFSKGARSREAEEELASRMLLNLIAQSAGLGERVELGLVAEEAIKQSALQAIDPVAQLAGGGIASVKIHYAARTADQPVTGAIYPGSFNPIHFGHRALAAAAERFLAMPVTFEITIVNADKAPIARSELEQRLRQFEPEESVVVTRAPLFVEKARLFPGSVFIIGFDTAVRLIELRFYNGSADDRDAALAAIGEQGCRFLVAGRADNDQFKTLSHVRMSESAKALFIELPESSFRADISATALRKRKIAPRTGDA